MKTLKILWLVGLALWFAAVVVGIVELAEGWGAVERTFRALIDAL